MHIDFYYHYLINNNIYKYPIVTLKIILNVIPIFMIQIMRIKLINQSLKVKINPIIK